MQEAIAGLVGLGEFPASDVASEEVIAQYECLLEKVQAPVSDADARALCTLLGPDDCFGLAWTLLHLVESAPGWPIASALIKVSNPWQEILRGRL